MKVLKEIYEYRTMIVNLVQRDLRGRYKGSVLGFLWTFLNPLFQLIVYTFVFSVVMRNGIEDYYLFLFVALVPWLFFAQSVTGGASCIWVQKEMVKKIYFPREVLPIAHVTAVFINMLLSFLVLIVVLLVSGKGIRLSVWIYLPVIMLVEYILALGIAFLVSAFTVFFRDMEYILGIVMMAWQFLSPVLYDASMVPEEVLPIFMMNPMAPVISAYRDVLYYKQAPAIETLLSATILGLLLLVIGSFVFSRLKRRFAEEL